MYAPQAYACSSLPFSSVGQVVLHPRSDAKKDENLPFVSGLDMSPCGAEGSPVTRVVRVVLLLDYVC